MANAAPCSLPPVPEKPNMRTLLLVIAALFAVDVVLAAGRYRPKACTPGYWGAENDAARTLYSTEVQPANPCTHLEECRPGRGSCAEKNCADLYRPRLPAMCTAERLPKCFCKRHLYRRNEDGKCVRRRLCKQ
ncbi:hypothetical protein V5799_011284 [Amblyomma americanum]|uniref:Uncharacterized protein n=1 Tax=Amblyomma americanum TaxID=6943 RepID=A0AAQ4EHT6_AMBAM